MSELTTSKVITFITAQCKKIVRQQSSGISNVTWDDATHSLVFTLTSGKTVSVAISASASGISYSNEASKLNSNDVQSAIDEVFTKLNKAINDLSDKVAFLNEANVFLDKNTFSAETQFDAVSEHNDDIHLNDSIVQLTDTTNDQVTKIGADEIVVEKGQGTSKTQTNVSFPSKSGTMLVDKDLENVAKTNEDNKFSTAQTITGNLTVNGEIIQSNQPLLARAEAQSLTDGEFLKWDATNKRAVCGVVGEATAESIKNNTEQIIDENNNFYAGGATKSTDDMYSIAIGPLAKANGKGNIVIGPGAQNQLNAMGAVVVGGYSSTTANDTVTLGHNARTEAEEAVQLGSGTNNIAKSLQILTDNIYKVATKMLTVANAQVGGNNVYGLLLGTSSPAVTMVGKAGQFYLDTKNTTLWVCIEATASGVYTWKQVQDKITQYADTVAEEVQTIKIGNLLIQYQLFTNVPGNSEKTLSFPVTFNRTPLPYYVSTAPGQSISNSIGLVDITQDYITVRTCGSTTNVIIGAIGYKD